jgi:tetratricopeptide (TPR) repeat protein
MVANRMGLSLYRPIQFWLPGVMRPRRLVKSRSILFAVLLLVTTAASAPTESHAAENAIAPQPDKNAEAVPLIRAGIEAYNGGDYPTAVNDLKRAQQLLPDNSPTALYLGLAYLKEGNLSEAIAAWEKYITLNAATSTEKTNNLQDTVSRDLTILVREQNRRQAESQIARERDIGPPDPNAIAITYYRNLGSKDLSPLQKGLTALIIADVAKVPELKVVERDQLQALLDEMKLSASGLTDPNTAVRAGHLLGAGRIVTGSYLDPKKGELRIDSILMQTTSTKVVSNQKVNGPVVHFYDVEKQLSAAILKDLGYSETDLKTRGLWQAVQTPQTQNYNAFVSFSLGLDALDHQDYARARSLFQQAYADDPSFALALQEVNRTPVQAASVGEVASSVGSQAPSVAAVIASIPGGIAPAPVTAPVSAPVTVTVPTIPTLPIVTITTVPPPAPPPPPSLPPPLSSFPPHR